jgi:hypothetical protein
MMVEFDIAVCFDKECVGISKKCWHQNNELGTNSCTQSLFMHAHIATGPGAPDRCGARAHLSRAEPRRFPLPDAPASSRF